MKLCTKFVHFVGYQYKTMSSGNSYTN